MADKMKRNDRMAIMAQMLMNSPNKIFTFSSFCGLFGAAKSTISEDVALLAKALRGQSLGEVETVTGAAGGVRYRAAVAGEKAVEFVETLCRRLATPERVLPGGFLYFSDILSTPDLAARMGDIIACQYYNAGADFVLTMETKGIPVALMTARALGVPLCIARRTSKVYEGSAVNINYVSGSSGHIETMSLSRRAVRGGQRALLVDDFLKGGGTARGMVSLMEEFSVSVVGLAFVMATREPHEKRVRGARALMLMDEPDDKGNVIIRPADWLYTSAY